VHSKAGKKSLLLLSMRKKADWAVSTTSRPGRTLVCMLPFLRPERNLILRHPCAVRRRFEIDKRWRSNERCRFFLIDTPLTVDSRFRIDTDKRLLITTYDEGTCILPPGQRFDFISFDPGNVFVQRLSDGGIVWRIHQDETRLQVSSFLDYLSPESSSKFQGLAICTWSFPRGICSSSAALTMK
jgi:hypothetical protein